MKWSEQVKAYKPGMSIQESITAMNMLVTPCRPRPRLLGFLWTPAQHDMYDCTTLLNTLTYATLDRCATCGLLVLGRGL